MPFRLTILGCNSAVPANGRHPTAQILQVRKSLFLIDCGEGTQLRMSDFNIHGRERIGQIFISHLHGDHIFGLPGLLTSYSLNNRTNDLTIFSPPGLEEMINAVLKASGAHLSYAVNFVVVDTEKSTQIFEDKQVTVTTIPLKHGMPVTGYLFREKKQPDNIIAEKIAEYDIPFQKIKAIKAGENFVTAEGKTITHEELTEPAPEPRSYAFCTDTSYKPDIVPLIKNVDLLYHETTFTTEEGVHAEKYGHSTAAQAAEIAKAANVGKLICGHYSARYGDLSPIEKEAKSIFPNSKAADEGDVFEVEFRRTKC